MNQRRSLLLAGTAALPLLNGCAAALAAVPGAAGRPPLERLRDEVRSAEVAFAAAMAARDLAAFGAHVAEDAVFINGGSALRGKAAVLAHWRRFFEGPTAPFAWEPALVEISGQGRLGYTEGPVTAGGQVIARFYTTWQHQPDGRWRVIFDNGYSVCNA